MPYVEEPDRSPGQQGDSIHIYNDNGGLGGFGELECHGQAIGGLTGRSTSVDQMVLWLYVGAADKVTEIAAHLLHRSLSCGVRKNIFLTIKKFDLFLERIE